jgi:hypothetical protein
MFRDKRSFRDRECDWDIEDTRDNVQEVERWWYVSLIAKVKELLEKNKIRRKRK